MSFVKIARASLFRIEEELQFIYARRTLLCAVTKNTVKFYHTNNGAYGHPRTTATAKADVNDTSFPVNDYRVYNLVQAFRHHGHRIANVDLLGLQINSPDIAELNPLTYGLDASAVHELEGLTYFGPKRGSVDDIVLHLKRVYCGPLTVEFQHLQCLQEKEWFTKHFEQIQNEVLSKECRIQSCKLMLKSQAFDHFLANKFTTVKRYGGEGAESVMAFYDEFFSMAAQVNISNVVIANAHRGRLNLLTCLLHFPPVAMFQKMKGKREFPENVAGAGDVLSHLFASVDLQYGCRSIHVSLLPNPSHLEAVNPVACGKTRAKMQSLKVGDYSDTGFSGNYEVVCLQVHGDAAFSGQGIIAETFALANVPHYRIGGTVHLIINNQIGYTTEAERTRSSEYCSDVGKIIGCPIIRVNADYPEEVVKACRLAVLYRERFNRDVVVDLICYRKWGHNELDEPSLTQPLMYKVIQSRSNVPDAYAERLTNEGVCSKEDLHNDVNQWIATLSENLTQFDSYVPKANHLMKQWSGLVQASSAITVWDTGIKDDILKFIGGKSVLLPKGFTVHPTLKKTHIERRLQKMHDGIDIDWATAEALAVGSLLLQGFNVRISGQDVGRGTFSQRHAMFVDQQTDEGYIPLNHMFPEQNCFFEVANSILSEEAVLGYEYGFSIENPKTLVMWEAQFGDFFNGAQIIIDTFVTGGESKWLLQSGLVMILPHGMDGAGPEHSTCRVERFLQASDSREDGVDGDDVNIQIVNPTTPAQYFHVLRRQMIRNFRKPLIIIGPKVLLRHPLAVSNIVEIGPGTMFQPVLSDDSMDPKNVKRVIFVSGKHYYSLLKERETKGFNNMAIVRLECLCPFPVKELQAEIQKFSNAEDFVWSQEEHRNYGSWTFVAPRFQNVIGIKLRYIGRSVLAIPAVGVGDVHQQEAKQIVEATFS